MSYRLDVSGLRKAISALERSLAVTGSIDEGAPEALVETLRAGVIQTFEFSYELCWKFMKRWLALNVSPDAADGAPRIELFRLAAENRLIDSVDIWMVFHMARNKTSHTYDADIAEDVYRTAALFSPYAKGFLAQLEKRV
jgi:nucleotidyltransferase substrate binding protein (TIGR01987 family)